MSNPPDGISAGPLSDADFFKWEAGKKKINEFKYIFYLFDAISVLVITGPEDTPYENGVFVAHLTFPSDYPFAYEKKKRKKKQSEFLFFLTFASVHRKWFL